MIYGLAKSLAYPRRKDGGNFFVTRRGGGRESAPCGSGWIIFKRRSGKMRSWEGENEELVGWDGKDIVGVGGLGLGSLC